MALFKNKHFLIGFSFIIILLTSSFVNQIIFGDNIITEKLQYKGGELVGTPPFPPSWHHPFGTDTASQDLLQMVIYGAKFTIITALVVTICRMVISIIIGVFTALYFPRIKKWLTEFGEAFHFFPGTLLTFFLVVSVLTMAYGGFKYPFMQRWGFEVFIMTIIALPTLTMVISEETDRLKSQQFIDASRLLGAGNLHIAKWHISPFIRHNLLILAAEQFMNSLLILAHLGVLKVFLGGTWIDYSPIKQPPRTVSMEWSGLIGSKLDNLLIYPWITLTPIIFFTLTILAVHSMIIGINQQDNKHLNL
ncbi:ABC transporter permease [Scopulibacillus darangshiensis]|nr:peptide ABC transporter permease [Scopulibacillus darangshiensis]